MLMSMYAIAEPPITHATSAVQILAWKTLAMESPAPSRPCSPIDVMAVPTSATAAKAEPQHRPPEQGTHVNRPVCERRNQRERQRAIGQRVREALTGIHPEGV